MYDNSVVRVLDFSFFPFLFLVAGGQIQSGRVVIMEFFYHNLFFIRKLVIAEDEQ